MQNELEKYQVMIKYKLKRGMGSIDGFLLGVALCFFFFFVTAFLLLDQDFITWNPSSEKKEVQKNEPEKKGESSTAPIVTTNSTEIVPIQVSPKKPVGDKITAIRTLSKEFDFESTTTFKPGKIAAIERDRSESYKAFYDLIIHEPKPAITLDEVTHSSSALASQLTDLNLLLETATINPYWQKLYRLKKQRTADNAHHLLKLLTKHNYYDCNTILNLKHPQTNRRALLVQADMDVVADGSDGDRLPTMPEEIVTSTHYQPTTSYSWEKQTNTPNPMVLGFEQRIRNANTELSKPSTPSDRKSWLKNRKKMLQDGITEMKKRSFLIAEYDPFIVLPVPIIVAKDAYSPNVGDYAIVFHGSKAYPAIVGDAGPEYKMGEASLRIAKEINYNSSPYRRPVNDLSVSYLVFPGTRKQPHRAPDYQDIHDECLLHIKDLGGLGIELHNWENSLPGKENNNNGEVEVLPPPLNQ